MLPLIGYTDRLSVRPGETIDFKVSSASEDPYCARLVRVVSADPNPAGPGLIEHELAASFDGSYPSRVQQFFPGSYGHVETGNKFPALKAFTLTADIWPTMVSGKEQSIICLADSERSIVTLGLDANGAIVASVDVTGRAVVTVRTDTPLTERRWYRIWLTYNEKSDELSVGYLPVQGTGVITASTPIEAEIQTTDIEQIYFATDKTRQHFNGKIDSPAILDGAVDPDQLKHCDPAALVAGWDFSRGISGSRIEDLGALTFDGELHNHPARAMTGSNWDGSEMCWTHAPEQYGAIHFHDDDIYDFEWETDFSFRIPADLPSGIYAVRIQCGEHYDVLPFFVCPPKGETRASLCVLVSTFTYTVYGNHARPDFQPSWNERIAKWNAYPHNSAEHREYGLSTYNFHSDGSGICHGSHLRPLFTLRPGYLSFCAGTDSGLRHFQADTHLITWLESMGYDYDIITDQELNDEGVQAISQYKAVTTGSHPEYHTKETLDALQAYRDEGGNLLYLGGNGFYWRIALHKEQPSLIEIRRGEGGIRAWAAEPGEYYNAFDGTYGGLWRRSGRAPQMLAGVGFSAQGTFLGSYYRRNPQTTDDAVAWIFDGVEDEILGDFGLSGGGAAGFELDRVDERLGSPPQIRILASSENHQGTFVLVPEEQLTHLTNWPGKPVEDLLRADMVYFELPGGGRVFSTGSITFCGSLLHNYADNNISRIVVNVLNRFLV